ncbi:MAG: hypothetical protein LBM77_05530 [Spirochaetaceae bacterium]|jgi:hypothetical protein|nr:hypothetical protein [Spirochaetaceae bacterium]
MKENDQHCRQCDYYPNDCPAVYKDYDPAKQGVPCPGFIESEKRKRDKCLDDLKKGT